MRVESEGTNALMRFGLIPNLFQNFHSAFSLLKARIKESAFHGEFA